MTNGEELPPDVPPHLTGYGRVIRNAVVVCMGIGALIGLCGSFMIAPQADSVKRVWVMIIAPFILGGAGAFLGVCLTCAVAPSSFLGGPRGKAWMKEIGTNNIFVARIVCALLGVAILLFMLGFAYLLMKGPMDHE